MAKKAEKKSTKSMGRKQMKKTKGGFTGGVMINGGGITGNQINWGDQKVSPAPGQITGNAGGLIGL
jgi:hypothetical protein